MTAAGAFAGSFVTVVALNAAFLWRVGELAAQPEMKEHQQLTGGFYRSASSDDIMAPWLKFARYDLIQPEVIALGSSRVLQFREQHFIRPFANMGMTFDYAFLPNIARALVTRPSRLRIVILSLDFWQVHAGVNNATPELHWDPRAAGFQWSVDNSLRQNISGLKEAVRGSIGKFVSGSFYQALTGMLGMTDAVNAIRYRDPAGRRTENRGVAAILEGSGMAADGSFYYDWVFGGARKPAGFDDVLARIEHGNEGFQHAATVDPLRWSYIERARSIFRDAGVEVITVIPPVAPSVARTMSRSGHYGVLDDLGSRLGADAAFFNFHDGASFGTSDCEFVDGYHGGEVTYLRLLEIMASRNFLNGFVDIEHLRSLITQFSGHAIASVEPRAGDRTRREGDFLSLGCSK